MPADRRADRGHRPDLAERFPGTQRKWFTFTNGTHVDSLDPETLNRWCDFLQLYVAHVTPLAGCATVRAAAPLVYQQAVGINGITLPPDPIQQQPTYDGALAAFQALAPIRVLFDNGAGEAQHPGNPSPGFLSTRSRASRSPARRRATGTSQGTGRWRPANRPDPVTPRSPGTHTPAH